MHPVQQDPSDCRSSMSAASLLSRAVSFSWVLGLVSSVIVCHPDGIHAIAPDTRGMREHRHSDPSNALMFIRALVCQGVCFFDAPSRVPACTLTGMMEHIIAIFVRFCPCCKPKEEVCVSYCVRVCQSCSLPVFPTLPCPLCAHVAVRARTEMLDKTAG